MNDKLQILDLVAMLTAPGIDRNAYIRVATIPAPKHCAGLITEVRKKEANQYVIVACQDRD